MERFLIGLIECSEIADAICNCVTDFYLKRALRAIKESDGQITIIGNSGGIGFHLRIMHLPELWRVYIKFYSIKLIRTFKDMGFIYWIHTVKSKRYGARKSEKQFRNKLIFHVE
ncbi:MAG: hypothetical protein NC932_00930 [Candidatus Omnitrophica bacterium]|nr:hypothetical protein [Candidatus Omnitrophota bacterium]